MLLTPCHCTIVIASLAYFNHEMYFNQERTKGIDLNGSNLVKKNKNHYQNFRQGNILNDTHEIRINTPEVIIRATSNGTKNAMAISTDLKAIEKKHPKKVSKS